MGFTGITAWKDAVATVKFPRYVTKFLVIAEAVVRTVGQAICVTQARSFIIC